MNLYVGKSTKSTTEYYAVRFPVSVFKIRYEPHKAYEAREEFFLCVFAVKINRGYADDFFGDPSPETTYSNL